MDVETYPDDSGCRARIDEPRDVSSKLIRAFAYLLQVEIGGFVDEHVGGTQGIGRILTGDEFDGARLQRDEKKWKQQAHSGAVRSAAQSPDQPVTVSIRRRGALEAFPQDLLILLVIGSPISIARWYRLCIG